MSNVVPFPPLAAASAPSAGRHLAARFLEHPPACSHAVQFYDDHDFLVETVAAFIGHGLDSGHSALVVATPEHTDGIILRLGKDRVANALAEKRLMLADADALLARFMFGGELSPPACANALDVVLRELPAAAAGGPLRAFGEMVDRLWQHGQAEAAMQLEEVWCQICDEQKISLLCGYAMSTFYKQDESPRFHEVCRLHSHVMPTEKFARAAGNDFERLREISLLEQRERLLQGEVFYREQLERALRQLSRPDAGADRASTPWLEGRNLTSDTLRAAARELLEPSAELIAIARTLLARQAEPGGADDLARLNAALERLQGAAARLHDASGTPPPEEASLELSAAARSR